MAREQRELRERVAQLVGARVRSVEHVQSLWSGYGSLLRMSLVDAVHQTVIVKSVAPPTHADRRSASHRRKCRSYDVEVAFYREVAGRCPAEARVATLLASEVGQGQWLLVLEDLDDAGYSGRRRRCSRPELLACLDWLAAFHATFLGVSPGNLWSTGTYWHLKTRREELENIADQNVVAQAPLLDRALQQATFKTLVHGDAKEANFCFGPRGVAAVDFQYVGGGVGVRDVAYLLGSGSTEHARVSEEDALSHYFAQLRGHLAERLTAEQVAALEAEWRMLLPIAQQDFARFLAGWAP